MNDKRWTLLDERLDVVAVTAWEVLAIRIAMGIGAALLMRPIFENMPKVKRSIFAKNKLDVVPHDQNMVTKFHEEIFQAIRNSDPREASHAMLAHLKYTEKNFMESLK